MTALFSSRSPVAKIFRCIKLLFVRTNHHFIFQVHSTASVEIEDLPSGLNKISAELLAYDLSDAAPQGTAGLRDEVVFFVQSSEDVHGHEIDETHLLRLQPPSGLMVIGRYFQLVKHFFTFVSYFLSQNNSASHNQ
jgi:hypothetical protein